MEIFDTRDRLHDHMTIGLRRGCVACAQFEADMAISKRAYEKVLAEQAVSVNPLSAHPDREAPPFERRVETKRGGLVARLPVTL